MAQSAEQLPKVFQILREACEKYGYEFNIIDTYSQHLIEIGSGQKYLPLATNSVYPLNLGVSVRIANDKAHTYTLLKEKGVHVPRGGHFFLQNEYRELRGDGRELSDAYSFAEELGYPVFVKPNNGRMGQLAKVVKNREELQAHLAEIEQISRIAIIQEVMSAQECRIFVIDGKVQFVYHKKPPVLSGNGAQTIQELLEEFNTLVEAQGKEALAAGSEFFQNQLREEGLSLNDILSAGQQISVSPNSNPSQGGVITDFSTTVSPEVQAWARRVADIMNLRVCGIDVFAPHSLQDSPDTFTLLEVNANPTLLSIYQAGHTDISLGVWGDILNKYFGS